MDEKQIYWLYCRFKDLIRDAQGKPINEQTAVDIYLKIEDIHDITRKSRADNPKIDKDIQNYIKCFLKVIQSAEMLNKPL